MIFGVCQRTHSTPACPDKLFSAWWWTLASTRALCFLLAFWPIASGMFATACPTDMVELAPWDTALALIVCETHPSRWCCTGAYVDTKRLIVQL